VATIVSETATQWKHQVDEIARLVPKVEPISVPLAQNGPGRRTVGWRLIIVRVGV
jgi:hypothetical protein